MKNEESASAFMLQVILHSSFLILHFYNKLLANSLN